MLLLVQKLFLGFALFLGRLDQLFKSFNRQLHVLVVFLKDFNLLCGPRIGFVLEVVQDQASVPIEIIVVAFAHQIFINNLATEWRTVSELVRKTLRQVVVLAPRLSLPRTI